MKVREAIVHVLRREDEPLTTSEIRDRILERELFTFKESTNPTNIVNKAIRRHCLDVCNDDSRSDKFFREGPRSRYRLLPRPVTQDLKTGRVSESSFPEFESVPEDKSDKDFKVVEAHSKYLSEFKEAVLSELKEISPLHFERFGKRLVEAYGFTEVENTRPTADGGIDGSGLMRVGLGMIRSAFECKRWAKNCVGVRETRDFWASVHHGQFHQGIYFTTSSFSKPAIEFAQDSPAVPIILVPGEEIVEIMMRKGIGLRRTAELPLYTNELSSVFGEMLRE